MASRSDTIKYYINIINTAVRGEDVRNAIVELLKLANNSQSNANTLDGHNAGYFAKQSDMDQILPLANGLVEGSTRPVGSGDLYYYLNTNVKNELNEILQEFSSGTITDKIEDLADVRYRIMVALNNKGAALTTSSTFSSFADKIDDIPVSMNFQTESLNVTENDTYTAPENKAYTTVKVDVNPTLVTKTIKKLGTFKASDEGEDVYGFSEVTVELDSGGGGGEEGDLKLITKAVDVSNMPPASGTERSKTFKASDDEALGYSEVTVNTAGLFGEKDTINVDPANFGEEQVFLASDDNLYGYSKITIKIVESEGPFTVEFWNGINRWDTVTVEYKGGNAQPSRGSPPAPEGKVFAGWDPDPINVTRNMKCYARFRDEQHIGYDTEIPLTWEEIGQNGGADVPVGAYKILYYKSFEALDGTTIDGGAICMQKVYDQPEGNSGSKSTWVSTNPVPFTSTLYKKKTDGAAVVTNKYGYPDSDLRNLLMNGFRSAISRCTEERYGNSGAIVSYIKPVIKYTRVWDYETNQYLPAYAPESGGEDTIWIPSNKENPSPYGGRVHVETAGPTYEFKTEGIVLPEGFSFNRMGGVTRTLYSREAIGDPATSVTYRFTHPDTGGSLNQYTWYQRSNASPYDTSVECSFLIGFCT